MISSRPQVLGVEITPGTHAELLGAFRDHLLTGHGLLHIVTANPEYVMFARRDSLFRQAVNGAGIVTVDGAGLAIATRMLHPDIPVERYTGVTLTPDLAAISAETGESLFLLGAGPGVADAAAAELRRRVPGAIIAGTWADGSPHPEHDAESIQRIRGAHANILLVAYGAPAQIHWIQRNLPALEAAGVRIVAGIGGAFDYISGTTPWAPAIVRKLGLEWLYRLVREPKRWRRQLVLPQFAMLVLAEVGRRRLRGRVE